MWFLGKGLQLAGLTGCTLALFWGLVDKDNGMTYELGGLAISFILFYLGKVICEKVSKG